MTPVVLIGLMVAAALVLAITWIEPRVLGGPTAAKPAGAGSPEVESPAAEGSAGERGLEPVRVQDGGGRVEQSSRRAA